MGNLFAKLKKSPRLRPSVRLYCSPSSTLAMYIRFALLYKNLDLELVPTDTPPFEYETPVLQIGTDVVSGYRETLLHFIEMRFPKPPLPISAAETTPLVVRMTWLQHRSVMWHVERMVRWAEDLVTRTERIAVDPAVGSPKMEIKKFEQSYSQLLEVLLEHARMEETVVFPILEKADRGICNSANEEHARDLPIMNGIKEDIKSIGVLKYGSPDYQESLSNIAMRLNSLENHCKEHFGEEENDLLPLIEATELSEEQQKEILGQCYDSMKVTHSDLLDFFLEGLIPLQAMQYLDIFMKFTPTTNNLSSTLQILVV